MYYTKVRLKTLTANIDLPIIGALQTDPYLLRSIDGLGPPGVDVLISDTPTQGGVYQGRRPQLRQLVITTELNPNTAVNQTVSDLRERLYGLLDPGYSDLMTVQFINDQTVVAYTEGYISKIEHSFFAQEPVTQITIECNSPYILYPVVVPVPGPLSNTYPNVPNIGSAKSGFELEIAITATATQWYLYDIVQAKKMGFTRDFQAGDVLKINTNPGKRVATLTRGGVTSSLLPYVNSAGAIDFDWLLMRPGTNSYSTSRVDNSSQTFNFNVFRYQPKFWGV